MRQKSLLLQLSQSPMLWKDSDWWGVLVQRFCNFSHNIQGNSYERVNKTVFMITFSFLDQTLWCDPHWNRLSETIPMSGYIIGFGWEIRKLAFWKLSILDLICCPDIINLFYTRTDQISTYMYTYTHTMCPTFVKTIKCID